MEKAYVKPSMESEEFVPNTYVAACGDSGTTYLFTCDAGGGYSGNVYVESNGVAGLQTDGEWIPGTGWGDWGHWQSADRSLGGYHACGTKHEADSDDPFLNGYYVTEEWVPGSGFWNPGHMETVVTDVIVWRGPYNNNTHCTTNLDKDSWETAKS